MRREDKQRKSKKGRKFNKGRLEVGGGKEGNI
jgi:hypothetical protein